jgi:hypothetical protein
MTIRGSLPNVAKNASNINKLGRISDPSLGPSTPPPRAKVWKLRVAMSMARLWRDQGRRDEARDLLAPVYGWDLGPADGAASVKREAPRLVAVPHRLASSSPSCRYSSALRAGAKTGKITEIAVKATQGTRAISASPEFSLLPPLAFCEGLTQVRDQSFERLAGRRDEPEPRASPRRHRVQV